MTWLSSVRLREVHLIPNGLGQEISYIAYQLSWLIARTAIGLVLVLFAPAITARFYPSTATKETTHSDDEVKLLKVGIQLLAVYALLLAVQYGAGVIIGLMQIDNYAVLLETEPEYLSNLLNFGLNIAFAAILLMWNDRVVTLIAKIRYVPERDADKPPSANE